MAMFIYKSLTIKLKETMTIETETRLDDGGRMKHDGTQLRESNVNFLAIIVAVLAVGGE